MTKPELKVMVVDDTALYRTILSRAVDALPGCSVAATAANGELALAKMDAHQPDLVLLDCEMPVLGGLETLEVLRKKYPRTAVVMVSGVNKNAANVTMQALKSGALEFIAKPEGATPEESQRILQERLGQVCAIAAQVVAKSAVNAARARLAGLAERALPPAPARQAAAPRRPDRHGFAATVLAIGISTGGPAALGKVLPALPASLGVPVLIVQHMPAYFTDSLAKSLAKHCAMPVTEALDGETLQPNHVYLAPGGRHFEVKKGPGSTLTAAITDGPPVKNCRPSVDVLFRSLAALCGATTAAAVLTGMGDDGCDGVRALKARGAYCITQSRDTCTVYGMPRAVDEAGLSDEQIDLDGIASRLTALAAKARAAS